MMIFNEQLNGSNLTLEFRGNLDDQTATQVEEKLGSLLEEKDISNVFVDLSEVKYISSSGIRSLIIAHKKAIKINKRIVIVKTSDKAKEILNTVGILELFS